MMENEGEEMKEDTPKHDENKRCFIEHAEVILSGRWISRKNLLCNCHDSRGDKTPLYGISRRDQKSWDLHKHRRRHGHV